MTDQPTVTRKRVARPAGVAKPKKAPKPKIVPFVALVAVGKEKDMLGAPNQEILHNMFQGFTPEQQSAVTLWMNTLAKEPLLAEGYKKAFRWWRSYRGLHPARDINL